MDRNDLFTADELHSNSMNDKPIIGKLSPSSVSRRIIESIKNSIARQLDPDNRKITECEIIPNGYVNEVWIKSSSDGWCEDDKMLFSYFPDELCFTVNELLGKTEAQALTLFTNKDISYLRS